MFHMKTYFTACSDGLYGSNCLHTCSPFCLHVPCDSRTGECIGGCIRGLHGFNCMQGWLLLETLFF